MLFKSKHEKVYHDENHDKEYDRNRFYLLIKK